MREMRVSILQSIWTIKWNNACATPRPGLAYRKSLMMVAIIVIVQDMGTYKLIHYLEKLSELENIITVLQKMILIWPRS